VYSSSYSKAYSDMLDGQVERRMRSAVVSVGSYWYTAWVDAGQPDLNKMVLNLVNESDSLEDVGKKSEEKLKIREHE